MMNAVDFYCGQYLVNPVNQLILSPFPTELNKPLLVRLSILYHATVVLVNSQMTSIFYFLLGRVNNSISCACFERNTALAVKILASQKNARAQNYLGYLYESGKGVKQNNEKAFYYYRLAAHQNITNAQLKIGLMYLEGKGITQSDEQQAVFYLKLASDNGSLEARYRLSLLYLSGHGVEKNEKKALQLCQSTANNGYMLAQFKLAKSYEYGLNGVSKNQQKAAEYYKGAADQGHLEAKHRYGIFCCLGQGCSQNNQEAIKYLQSAYDLGYLESKIYLDKILSYENRVRIYHYWNMRE
ncbi:hypothetical protein DB44_CX00080 [Candidatus Protochlamydia amoebophila]|uniref:Uncharacterized protein n=2 Tax=Candidatus Protochlamydia amoebophila TaxID=362787 RepID=A0A0C1HAF0_9BACT|nr:hypothetical protein DB44_CX00080 [Candidatus Protochlamydia amoebophila]